MIFPEVRDDFGIAVRGEMMSAAFQLGALLDVVEQFAVVDDKDAAVFVADGLPAVRQADDAQPARGQAQTGHFKKAIFIGTAVNERRRHCLEHSCRQRPPATQINDPCDPAHRRVLSLRTQHHVLSIPFIPSPPRTVGGPFGP